MIKSRVSSNWSSGSNPVGERASKSKKLYTHTHCYDDKLEKFEKINKKIKIKKIKSKTGYGPRQALNKVYRESSANSES